MRKLLIIPLILLGGCAAGGTPPTDCIRALEAADELIQSHLDVEGALVDVLGVVPDALRDGSLANLSRLQVKTEHALEVMETVSSTDYMTLREQCLTP